MVYRRRRTRGPAPTSRRRCRSGSCSTPSTSPPGPRTAGRSGSRSSSGTRCSRSTRATSSRASWARRPGSASTGPPAGRPGRDRRDRPDAACRSSRRRPAAGCRRPAGRAGRPAPLLRPPGPGAAPGAGRPLPAGRRRAARRADPGRAEGLDRWAVGDRMLRLHLQGHDLSRLRDAEWRRGAVPPRSFGARALGRAGRGGRGGGGAGRCVPHRAGRSGTRSSVDLPGPGVRLTGIVALLSGDHLIRVGFSGCRAKHRLQAWLELLALTATDPGRPGGPSPSAAAARSSVRSAAAGPPRCWPTWSSCAGPGCASRCPSPRASAEYAAHPARRPAARHDKKLLRTDLGPGPRRGVRAVLRARGQLDGPAGAASRRRRGARRLGEPSRFGTLARRVFPPLLQCRGAHVTDAAAASSTSAARCRRAPPCWRPARGRARRYTIASLAARYLAEGQVELTS